MSDSYMPEDSNDPTAGSSGGPASDFTATVAKARKSTNALGVSATAFANAMTKAFTQATVGGKQFDDVLKSMALKLSGLAVTQAFKPVATGIAKGLTGLLGDLFGTGSATSGGGGGGGGFGPVGQGNCCCQPAAGGCFGGGMPPIISTFRNVMPFASGGVIGTPTYFPLSSGGLGLAGEAGPEAIVPLSRGADGQLGIAMNGGGAPVNISVQIATPDAGSFRRSEAYITGQIARAVARGQRSF